MVEKNLVLCGFMGCGKTTLGSLLAQRLDMEFLDTDRYIEEQNGTTIPELFRLYSEDGFRDREHRAILELSARQGLVLSTGGGVLTFPRNVAPLRESGVLLFLNPGFEECYRRIAGSDRPLVHSNTREELAELYACREPMYRTAAHLELALTGSQQQWVNAALALVRPAL